jgi:hypothetical protein
VEPMGFESTSNMITKEFCGATWPSKELKGKERNSYCPLIAPEKLTSGDVSLNDSGRDERI